MPERKDFLTKIEKADIAVQTAGILGVGFGGGALEIHLSWLADQAGMDALMLLHGIAAVALTSLGGWLALEHSVAAFERIDKRRESRQD